MPNYIKQSYEILSPIDGDKILKSIEEAAKVCYKSEHTISEGSAKTFVKKLVNWRHESPLEHISISVKFITDRGVTHELVRHRIGAYNQESTRYCNYGLNKFGNHIAVVKSRAIEVCEEADALFEEAMYAAESAYMQLLKLGIRPEDARDVLPTCLKTEIIATYNLREWRHIFKLRTAKAAHPKIRALLIPLLEEFKEKIPVVFDDIKVED